MRETYHAAQYAQDKHVRNETSGVDKNAGQFNQGSQRVGYSKMHESDEILLGETEQVILENWMRSMKPIADFSTKKS